MAVPAPASLPMALKEAADEAIRAQSPDVAAEGM